MQTSAILAIILLTKAIHAADDVEFFEKRVRPVLAANCYSCHAAAKQFAGLRLDSREHVLKGGQSGPAAIPGKPAESLLIKAVRHEGPKMPLGGKLSAPEVSALEDWVRQGLPWPEDKNAVKSGAGAPAFYQKLIREHWAFQPVRTSKAPRTRGNPVDAFVRAKLEAAGLKLAPPAGPRDLARRVSNVLTGLPPDQPDKHSLAPYEAYVDRLLASPHFGEQWARHWMDVVRYAETYGYEWNYEIHGAWRYRDYLIRAFNSDLPYDQFVREHIAGDLLAKPRTRENGKWNESVVGATFFRLGEMGHDDCIQFRELRTDVVDNQIDTLTKAFQGLTVSCARCHDHKIDPIPTEDYYALYGILNSSRPVTRTLNLQGPSEASRSRLLQLKGEIRKQLADAWLKETSLLSRQLAAAFAWRTDAKDGALAAAHLDPLRVNLWLKLLDRKKVDLDDPLYPLAQMADSKKPAETWTDLISQYKKEIAERAVYNREKFIQVGGFGKELPAGWSMDGLGLLAGPSQSGDFGVATEGYQAVSGIFPSGLFTNLLSDRMNGVLRSPLLPKNKKFLSMQVMGGNSGAQRTIVDHCVIGEEHQILDSPALKWITITTRNEQQLPVYVELNTKSDNPRLPERPGKFKSMPSEASQRSYFGITRAYLHDEKITPKADLSHMQRLLGSPPPAESTAQAQLFQDAVQGVVRAWREDHASEEDIVWLDWLLREQVISNSRHLTPALRALTDQYRAVEASLEAPEVVYSMGDFDRGWDNPIFTAGQALSLGRPAPRHFLTLMPAELRQVGTAQSGRRELAESIASARNPLTARVMVNRVWHYVFGRGLVPTTDNVGRYGEQPSHQELLDHLAARFIEEGWSVKKLIRLLVTSDTFQQSSDPSPAAREADPQNRLWSRYPVRRLDAEAIRDNILTVSGSLDRTLYGPSIEPHRDEPKQYRRLFQGPLDGNGRRSIYLKITRMEGPRFLELFDLPPPLQTRGNRDVTNVASQSLALLNDPFVLDQARAWADRLVARKDDAVDARLNAMFLEALGRPPSNQDLERWRSLAARLGAQYQVAAADLLASKAVWKDIAHTLFNTKEFLYLR
ncbi:MAG TPA: PSD1 and planctomycete cytochrome C domain-containing protein [Bryobacteraceae bacterium]|nr:PSD1 and planctomycete cytochrome C domain-containing protein [Bryobacteraceae bacterium]